MITRYIKGDITDTELEYIAHGVNCQNVMGSGVAKALFTKFPEVKIEYHKYCKNEKPNSLLGKVNIVFTGEKFIFNCFTQLNYGNDGEKYVSYSAIIKVFNRIVELVERELDSDGTPIVAIPKIGCGLAGGDWNVVSALINETVGDKLEIWVYELDEKKFSKRNDLA